MKVSFPNTILCCKCSAHFKISFIFNLKHKSVWATNGSSNPAYSLHRICLVIPSYYFLYLALKLQKCTFCSQPTLEVQLSNYIKLNLVKISNINKQLHTDTVILMVNLHWIMSYALLHYILGAGSSNVPVLVVWSALVK